MIFYNGILGPAVRKNVNYFLTSNSFFMRKQFPIVFKLVFKIFIILNSGSKGKCLFFRLDKIRESPKDKKDKKCKREMFTKKLA